MPFGGRVSPLPVGFSTGYARLDHGLFWGPQLHGAGGEGIKHGLRCPLRGHSYNAPVVVDVGEVLP